jgi:ACS family tartrate transporter-like MFS transporter
MPPTLEETTMRKVSWRLLPLIVAIYFVAYIDRTNVGFAAASMNKDLGFTPYIYGWGAGIFFIGYFFFEVPSNLILQRIGARIWIARIMATWGVVSGLMIFITGVTSFFAVRFLLGVAEAGFFPGVLLYFTYWFPATYRARVVSALFIAVPVSNAVAAAVSGSILRLDGILGLSGWKWMFLLESLPAVLLAPVVLMVLTDRPAKAAWLSSAERAWLTARLEQERRAVEATHAPLSLLRTFRDPRVLGLSLVYFTIVTATYGITFFLPLIVKGHGLSDMATGFVTAAPYLVGTVGMVVLAYSSDRRQERRWHVVGAAVLAAVGLMAAALTANLAGQIIAISIAAIGIYGSKPPFWPLPSRFLSGTAAAGGIAMMNSIGNLGGFVGPYIVGWLRTITEGYGAALFFLSACSLASAVMTLIVIKPERAVKGAAVAPF